MNRSVALLLFFVLAAFSIARPQEAHFQSP